MPKDIDVSPVAQQEVISYFSNIQPNENGVLLDSATAASQAISGACASTTPVPRIVDELLGMTKNEDEEQIIQAILDGAACYRKEHGTEPTGDRYIAALHSARNVFDAALSNQGHNPQSLVPRAPLIAMLSAFAEAVPFAGMLPADNQSNEAKLIITQMTAGSDFGDYSVNDAMSGVSGGGAFIDGARVLELNAPNDGVNYKFNVRTKSASGDPVPILSARTLVYVKGLQAAMASKSGTGVNSLGGNVTIANTMYAIGGTVNPSTGEISVTVVPPLPVGTVVNVRAFLDYESRPSMAPKINYVADTYSLFAHPSRCVYVASQDAMHQFISEVGVDPNSQAVMGARIQRNAEQHRIALSHCFMAARHQAAVDFDFAYADQIAQKTEAQMLISLLPLLSKVSQEMAERTNDHGSTHLYVTKALLTLFRSLGPELFTPSGLVDRPGIYRAGKLFGLYDVYYTPFVIADTADGKTAQMLVIGRSTQTARNPIIMGDAMPASIQPLGLGQDLMKGFGYLARDYCEPNPHQPSALGVALITLKNIKK